MLAAQGPGARWNEEKMHVCHRAVTKFVVKGLHPYVCSLFRLHFISLFRKGVLNYNLMTSGLSLQLSLKFLKLNHQYVYKSFI